MNSQKNIENTTSSSKYKVCIAPMQDWADRLDLFEQNQVEAASTALTITLQGLPTITGQGQPQLQPPVFNPNTPQLVVAASPDAPVLPTSVQRLSSVYLPAYAQHKSSEIQRERLALLEIFEAPHNLPVADYAKLTGRSRRAISYDIQAGKLLSLRRTGRLTRSSASWFRRY